MIKRPRDPTPVELKVLRVLWQRPGGASVRDVLDALGHAPDASATGMTTTMQRMVEKELLTVADDRRPRRYAAVKSQEDTLDAMLAGLKTRYFGGSLVSMARHLFGGRNLNADEVAEVKRILDADATARHEE